MTDVQERPLEAVCVLVVEDEYAVAADMTCWLEDGGAEVIGPAPTVQDALSLIQAHGPRLDRAVLDVNLRGEKVFAVADALLALDVPFIFCTGYDSDVLPVAYAHVARHAKPLNSNAVLAALAAATVLT